MKKQKNPPGLGLRLVAAEKLGAVLKGARISVTAQGADLAYTGALNGPFLFDGQEFIGASDSGLFAAEQGRQLTACKQRVAETGQGERPRQRRS